MEKLQGKLGYNMQTERYGLLVSDLWEKEFHCGDLLEIKIDDKWIKDIFEMDNKGNWYLKNNKIKEEELEDLQARILK